MNNPLLFDISPRTSPFIQLKGRIKFDLYKILSNRVVQGFLQAAYNTDYRGYGLDEVSTTYLQNGEGKSDGLSRKNVEFELADKQIELLYIPKSTE